MWRKEIHHEWWSKEKPERTTSSRIFAKVLRLFKVQDWAKEAKAKQNLTNKMQIKMQNKNANNKNNNKHDI